MDNLLMAQLILRRCSQAEQVTNRTFHYNPLLIAKFIGHRNAARKQRNDTAHPRLKGSEERTELQVVGVQQFVLSRLMPCVFD